MKDGVGQRDGWGAEGWVGQRDGWGRGVSGAEGRVGGRGMGGAEGWVGQRCGWGRGVDGAEGWVGQKDGWGRGAVMTAMLVAAHCFHAVSQKQMSTGKTALLCRNHSVRKGTFRCT